MTVSSEECNARRRVIYAQRSEEINARKRELYAVGYSNTVSQRGKESRAACPVCGKERRASYMARHMLTKHSDQ